MKIELTLNGRECTVDVPPMKRLLDVLREDLQQTGTKEGCGEGECGACNVLMNGELVTSCLVPAVQCAGSELVTVEGLAPEGTISPLQQNFLTCNGAQCGICTPGMLVSAKYFLDGEGRLPDEQVREALAGNLCRCTGYEAIVEAVERTAAEHPSDETAPVEARPPAARRPVRKPARVFTDKAPEKPAGKVAKKKVSSQVVVHTAAKPHKKKATAKPEKPEKKKKKARTSRTAARGASVSPKNKPSGKNIARGKSSSRTKPPKRGGRR